MSSKTPGQLKHEFNLGTEKDLKEHYEMMKKFPEMEHDEPNIAGVEPGKTGEVDLAVHQSGHCELCLPAPRPL